MISFQDLEFPESLQLHYVYRGDRQLGVLMASAGLPKERLARELARHGLHLRDGHVAMCHRVGEAAAPFIQRLQEEAEADLLTAGQIGDGG